jgi:hypothetical protein
VEAGKAKGTTTAASGDPRIVDELGSSIDGLVASPTPRTQAENSADCEHCGVLFRPVRFEQRFCSADCRKAFHNAHRPASQASQEASQASQEASHETRLNDITLADAGNRPHEFDWHRDPDVVVPHQSAIAVYFNPHGAVVIRQAGQYPDDDSWVVVRPENLSALIAALRRLQAEGQA